MSGAGSMTGEALLRVEDVTVEYAGHRGRRLQGLAGVTLEIAAGETLGLVGESGCGKSTLARAIMQLPPPTAGRVLLDGRDLATLGSRELRPLRKEFQIVFQDPAASLNPIRTVGKSIEAPLESIGGIDPVERRRRAEDMLEAVGLDPKRHYHRRPHQLSGGQCQRVSIARALITEPRMLICDEPVSSLDVSVQAQIVNLLKEVTSSRGLAMLFIAHDLAVVKNVSHRVAVMHLGRLCEVASCAALYESPAHPYTRLLLDAVPNPDPRRPLPSAPSVAAELPSPWDPPAGCRFRTRCPHARAECSAVQPELRETAPGRQVACHFPLR